MLNKISLTKKLKIKKQALNKKTKLAYIGKKQKYKKYYFLCKKQINKQQRDFIKKNKTKNHNTFKYQQQWLFC